LQNNALPSDGSLTIDAVHNEIVGSSKVRRLYAGQGKLAGFSGYVVVEFDHPFHWEARGPGRKFIRTAPGKLQTKVLQAVMSPLM
jgi:hypothetical protein